MRFGPVARGQRSYVQIVPVLTYIKLYCVAHRVRSAVSLTVGFRDAPLWDAPSGRASCCVTAPSCSLACPDLRSHCPGRPRQDSRYASLCVNRLRGLQAQLPKPSQVWTERMVGACQRTSRQLRLLSCRFGPLASAPLAADCRVEATVWMPQRTICRGIGGLLLVFVSLLLSVSLVACDSYQRPHTLTRLVDGASLCILSMLISCPPASP